MTTPESAQQPTKSKWIFDKSLNLPTLFMIVGMIATTVAFGFSVVTERDTRMSNQDRRIDAVERKADAAAASISRIESSVATQQRTQEGQLQTMRSEFREDLRNINGKLDALLINQIQKAPTSAVRPE